MMDLMLGGMGERHLEEDNVAVDQRDDAKIQIDCKKELK